MNSRLVRFLLLPHHPSGIASRTGAWSAFLYTQKFEEGEQGTQVIRLTGVALHVVHCTSRAPNWW